MKYKWLKNYKNHYGLNRNLKDGNLKQNFNHLLQEIKVFQIYQKDIHI